ncbi:unnamed protein product [Rotaria sordida]|uniref:Uncharacterized protein n=1 Tax=Rotaria sordida TaxID=392033 RepID=A0A816BP15_9BILA|nr:unnamed protein product [Rotaria sordida]CAF1612650.1 unnamed protein product [Rotaria sordida]
MNKISSLHVALPEMAISDHLALDFESYPFTIRHPTTNEVKFGAKSIYYRIFGFPCSIDTGPGCNERIDGTFITEDVNLITEFIKSRGGMPSLKIHDLPEDLQQKHMSYRNRDQDYPGKIIFDAYEQINDLWRPPIDLGEGSLELFLHDTLRCSQPVADKSDTVTFIYLAGHGLSKPTIDKLLAGSSLGDINKNLNEKHATTMFVHEFTTGSPYTPKTGDILAYATFLDQNIFLDEFVPCKTFHGNPIISRHLILLVDSCYSGNWIDHLYRIKSRLRFNKNISVTIQTSSTAEKSSNGLYFVPLFIKFQNLTEQELTEICEEYEQLDDKRKEDLTNRAVQLPLFYCAYNISIKLFNPDDSNDEKSLFMSTNGDDQLFFRIHGFRFFTKKSFFAFFADKYKELSIMLTPDSDELTVRPILPPNETDRFMKTFISLNPSVQKYHEALPSMQYNKDVPKMIIIGMKLKMAQNNTPLCIVAIASSIKFETTNTPEETKLCHYHLHVHFLPRQHVLYPGCISGLKLYDAKITMKTINNAKGQQPVSREVEARNQLDKDAQDYSRRANTQPPELYVPGYRAYSAPLLQCLSTWANNRDISDGTVWNDPYSWKAEQLLGDVIVRSREIIIDKKKAEETLVSNIQKIRES